MPRAKTTTPAAGAELVDQVLPGLDPDPAPKTPRPRSVRNPTGRGPGRPRKTAGPAGGMTHAQMVEKVSAELYMFAAIGVGGWELRDPCARVMTEDVIVHTPGGPVRQERLAAIIERVVGMLARYPKALQLAAETGILGEALMTAGLIWPILTTVYRAHGPAGEGHGEVERERDYAATYPAPALA